MRLALEAGLVDSFCPGMRALTGCKPFRRGSGDPPAGYRPGLSRESSGSAEPDAPAGGIEGTIAGPAAMAVGDVVAQILMPA